MLKRTLCALLALICVIGILPVTALAAEDDLVVEEATTSERVNMTYYANSSYYKYAWYYSKGSEKESNNSRSGANIIPADMIADDHIAVSGQVNFKNDPNDYYKFTITETSYLKLLCASGLSFSNTKFRLYNSSGTLLKTAEKKSTWEYDDGSKDTIYYLTYTLYPGTYYIRVYEPSKSGYSNITDGYMFIMHLYPRLNKPVVSTSNDKNSGKPEVSWNSVSGAQYYKVYRATSKSGTYYEKDVVYGTSWIDTAAKVGKTYYYKVQACSDSSYYADSNGESSKSSYKSRTCDCARPDVDISLKNGKPRLTWDKVTGAKEYKVYRATSENGTYKLMKTTTSTSYTNTGAGSGRTYYYKVKAIASKSAANPVYSYIDSITTP